MPAGLQNPIKVQSRLKYETPAPEVCNRCEDRANDLLQNTTLGGEKVEEEAGRDYEGQGWLVRAERTTEDDNR